MTISDTAVQAAGSNPYPDLTDLPPDFYKDTVAKYEAMAAADRAAHDEWEIGARGRVFPQPGRHAKPAVMVTAPDQGRAVTVPDAVPVPQFRPAAVPELPRRRPSVFARHLRHPKRDEAPERTEGIWQPPQSGNGTVPPPVADEREADTLMPGAVEPVPALDPKQDERLARFNDAHDDFPSKPDEWTDAAERAGRPGDGRDATTEMTAVLERPADQGDQK